MAGGPIPLLSFGTLNWLRGTIPIPLRPELNISATQLGRDGNRVLGAARLIGTPGERVVQETVPSGHIGPFMGANTLRLHWPKIAQWIVAQWTIRDARQADVRPA